MWRGKAGWVGVWAGVGLVGLAGLGIGGFGDWRASCVPRWRAGAGEMARFARWLSDYGFTLSRDGHDVGVEIFRGIVARRRQPAKMRHRAGARQFLTIATSTRRASVHDRRSFAHATIRSA